MLRIGIAFVLVGAFGFVRVRAFDVPAEQGFVTDIAGVLSTEEREIIDELLSAYRAETSNEIAILIVGTLHDEEPADVAVDVGRTWGVGDREKDNGILMLIAIDDREIFIATGYGLEGAVPDIVAKGIIENDILPRFREGLYADGIQAGIEALQKHIGGEYTADRYTHSESPDLPWDALAFLGFILLEFAGAFLARSKSWWLGGVIGAVLGCLVALFIGGWIAIVVLTLLGLLFDFIVSRTGIRNARGPRIGGGWGSGGGGGFGGFGGGSFGGGGAGGRW